MRGEPAEAGFLVGDRRQSVKLVYTIDKKPFIVPASTIWDGISDTINKFRKYFPPGGHSARPGGCLVCRPAHPSRSCFR
jgi:hypothetical protein